MKKFIKLFIKADGNEILRQYWRAHVLFFALLETAILGFSKKSLEIVRLAVRNRILSKMRREYRAFIVGYRKSNEALILKKRSNKVWVCWLQGIDQAPILVQRCFCSLQDNLIDKEIILITASNYRDYVKFPDHIQKKVDNGIISKTHMSDLLRLELLIKYGGTWIDATVFCTGKDYPKYILDSDLFVFQCLKPGLDGHCTSISSWLITACTNNPIILLTRELLYDYWKKHDKMTDYFLIHNCFQLAIETYSDEWKRVVPFSNSVPHILLLRLFEPFNAITWNEIKKMTSFHKLSYKFSNDEFIKKDTYYSEILGKCN